MTDIATMVNERLSRSAAEDRFSGAVLIATDGELLFERAYGWADRERELENTTATRFRLGSLNKSFTAAAVLQLEGQGLLELNAPLATYLPNYPSKPFADAVTLDQLLTHTAGAGDIFGPEFNSRRLELREIGDYIALFGGRAPDCEPGSRFAYSNYGYVVLGAVIEAVSGESYDDYLRDNIFAPLGMDATGSAPAMDGVAIGYMRTPEGLRANTTTLPYRGTPAGGGYSTVRDLFAFAEGLTRCRLFDPERSTRLTTGRVEMGPGLRYGYGFMEWTNGAARAFGNAGGAPGMSAVILVTPAERRTIVVLANRDPPTAQRVLELISTVLNDQ